MRESRVNGTHSGVAGVVSNDSTGCLQPQRLWESGDAQRDDDDGDDASISGTSSQDPSGVPTDTDSMISSSMLSSGVDEVVPASLMHPSHTVEFGSLTSDREKSSACGDNRSESHFSEKSWSSRQEEGSTSCAPPENRPSCPYTEIPSRKKFVPSSMSCSSLDISSSVTGPISPPPVTEAAVKTKRRNLKPSWSLSIRRRPDGFAGFFDFLPIFPKKAEEKKVSDEKLLADSLNASYICEAAGHFAVGQQQESIGDLESALEAYKEGITILLAGGQSDKDHKRRLIVRSKVEKYLTKAEQLYANLSKGKESNKSLFSSKTIQNLLVPPRASQILPSSNQAALPPANAEDLKNYRIVGIPAPGVLLVVNVAEKSGPKCCVVKILRKSSDPIMPTKQTIVPSNVPFMVKLIKWFDTETTIILLLQYAGGGKLEDFVSTYQTKPIAIIPHEMSPEEEEANTKVSSGDEPNLVEEENAISVLAAFAEHYCESTGKKVSQLDGGEQESCDSYARLFIDSDPEDCTSDQVESSKISVNHVSSIEDRSISSGVTTETTSASCGPSGSKPDTRASCSAVDSCGTIRSSSVGMEGKKEDVTVGKKGRNLASELKANSFATSLDASMSWTNLEAVDTGDLIESAKVLMQTVSRTLTQEVVVVCTTATDSNNVISPASPPAPPTSHSDNNEGKVSNGNVMKPSLSSYPPSSLSQGKQKEEWRKNNKAAACRRNSRSSENSENRAKSTGYDEERSTGVDPRESQFINWKNTKRHYCEGSQNDDEDGENNNERGGRVGGRRGSFKSQPSSADELLAAEEISPPNEQMKFSSTAPGKEDLLRQGEEKEEEENEGDGSITRRQESHYCQDSHNGESNENLCPSPPSPVPIQRVVPECCIKVWMAEMVLALEKLHSIGLTYGDLGMKNVLLGENGHILLAFTSQWSSVDHVPAASDWMAPEVHDSFEFFLAEKIHFSADWWSLGAILFYLLAGKTVQSAHPEGLHGNTVVRVPDKNLLGEDISQHAKSLMAELLQINPNLRLGYYGAEEIKSHPFFNGFDWDGALEGITN